MFMYNLNSSISLQLVEFSGDWETVTVENLWNLNVKLIQVPAMLTDFHTGHQLDSISISFEIIIKIILTIIPMFHNKFDNKP